MPSTTFETFPFPVGLTPNLPAASYATEPRAIAVAQAARGLLEFRDRWLNPPEWVDWADRAVSRLPATPGAPRGLHISTTKMLSVSCWLSTVVAEDSFLTPMRCGTSLPRGWCSSRPGLGRDCAAVRRARLFARRTAATLPPRFAAEAPAAGSPGRGISPLPDTVHTAGARRGQARAGSGRRHDRLGGASVVVDVLDRAVAAGNRSPSEGRRRPLPRTRRRRPNRRRSPLPRPSPAPYDQPPWSSQAGHGSRPSWRACSRIARLSNPCARRLFHSLRPLEARRHRVLDGGRSCTGVVPCRS